MSDIFEQLAPTGDEEVIDVTKNYADELIGEKKKYADTETAARALAEKELFIKRLERENAALRQETAAQQKLEDLVTKLSQAKSPSNVETHEPDPVVQQPNIEEQVSSIFARREAEARQDANKVAVTKALRENFGQNYVAHLQKTAETLGMSTDEMNALAARSPAAFLKLVGAERKPAADNLNPPPSTVSLQPRTEVSAGRTRSYYQKLMKTDKARFLSPQVQNEMHEQATRMGEAFFDV